MRSESTIFSKIIKAAFATTELLIILQILLKLFGANTDSQFVVWLYTVTDLLLFPFDNIFPSVTLPSGFVINISALFALVIYGFLYYLLNEMIHLITDAREGGSNEASR